MFVYPTTASYFGSGAVWPMMARGIAAAAPYGEFIADFILEWLLGMTFQYFTRS